MLTHNSDRTATSIFRDTTFVIMALNIIILTLGDRYGIMIATATASKYTGFSCNVSGFEDESLNLF